MRHFVIGDIHGAYKALIQCLERAKFDYTKDELICLGDVCDGWPQTNEAISELLKINHLSFILGNHDYWALKWAKTGITNEEWLKQGGANTVASYNGSLMSPTHRQLLYNAIPYLIQNNRLFVHGGIQLDKPIEQQSIDTFLWDRSLFKLAYNNSINGNEESLSQFDEIYIGHTPIHNYNYNQPIQACEVWLMDTGAGWDGVLSLMDINSKEIFTSDKVDTLYPPGSGRIKY